MGAKDFTEKRFEDFNDVFADIVNVLIFNGRREIHEDELETGMARSAYTEHEGKTEEQERDTKKFWKNGQIRLAVFGVENQTEEDQEMIFRNFSYDGSEYRDQIHRRNEIRRGNVSLSKKAKEGTADSEDEERKKVPDFYPVITIVLFFSEAHWRGPKSMRSYFGELRDLEPFIPDYTINVFEISYLTDEQLEMFQSDFKYVAEYFVGNRMKKEGLIPEFKITLDHLRHVEEFIELMNALTNSDCFSVLPMMIKEDGGKGKMMTIMFDEAREKGLAEGRAEGERIGEIKGRIKAFREDLHYSDDMIITKIMSLYAMSRETAEEYLQEVSAS